MNSRVSKTLVAFVALLAAASVAYGGWAAHLVDSVLVAEKSNEKHAKSVTLRMLAPEAFSSGVEVCVAYVNSASKSKGKVTATVSHRADGALMDQVRFSGKVMRVDTEGVDTGDLSAVTANAFFDCGELGAIRKDEEIAFKFDMKGFPKLRNNNNVQDGATVLGALVPNDLGLTARGRQETLDRLEATLLRRLIHSPEPR